MTGPVRLKGKWRRTDDARGRSASVAREAVQQAVAAGADQILLAATAIRAARRMRRVPRFRWRGIIEAGAIGVSEHRRTLRAACPVLAGPVVSPRKGGTVGLRASQDIVAIGCIPATVDHVTLLRQRGLLGQLVGAMQIRNVLGDNNTLGVLPWSLADAIARIDGWLAVSSLGRKIGMPGLASDARGLGQFLTMIVGAGETAEITAIVDALAGDKEGRIGLLSRDWNHAGMPSAQQHKSSTPVSYFSPCNGQALAVASARSDINKLA
jgi:hypothetical protein